MNAEKLAKEIGERIHAMRLSQGLSQQQLAQRSGLSASYVGMLERGVRLPHLEALSDVAEALGVPMGVFLADGSKEAEASSFSALMSPLNRVIGALKLKPDKILQAARLVWAMNAPEGQQSRPPV